MTCFKNANLNGEMVDIVVENGKISDIGRFDCDGVDLNGLRVFAGLVDIHAHGVIGYDTMDGNRLCEMSKYLAQNGTTSWLPTTMTVSLDDIKKVVNIKLPETYGANVLGFHLEGPYISPKHKGAQNEEFIRELDIDEFRSLQNIRIITLAPEKSGSAEFIKNCGAVVSIGHTDADYEQSKKAIENGALCLTHTFNAMKPLKHREPGPVGAAIEKNIYVQVICDGLHIHKSVIKMLYKTFGVDRMILISDSMRATGLGDGNYEFGGLPITVENSIAKTEDGAIAGSTSTLFTCVKKAIEFGIPVSDAFKMASETPSKLIGVKKGKIEKGYDADFIAIDNDYNIKYSVVGGKIVE